MKILVPTDFSKNALNAARFAAEFAKAKNAEITLLNAYQLKYTTASVFIDFDDSAKEISKEDLSEQEAILKEEFPEVKINARLELGGLDTVIESLRDDYDFVVMGTKGRTGLEAVLIGSETAKVIGNTTIPILAIPGDAAYSSLSKLFIALDLKETLNRKEVDLIEELTAEDKDLHLFHNYHDALEISTQEESDLIKKFQDYFPGQVVALDMKFNTNSVDAIEEAIEEFKPQLVVAKAKHRNLLHSLFHRSVTERLSYHTKKPLLVLKG